MSDLNSTSCMNSIAPYAYYDNHTILPRPCLQPIGVKHHRTTTYPPNDPTSNLTFRECGAIGTGDEDRWQKMATHVISLTSNDAAKGLITLYTSADFLLWNAAVDSRAWAHNSTTVFPYHLMSWIQMVISNNPYIHRRSSLNSLSLMLDVL